MSRFVCKVGFLAVFVCAVMTTIFFSLDDAYAQDYIMGEEQNQLQMKVHIIGEVKKPGEYLVSDKTNILELLSKASGPTEFSNLGSVTISRVQHGANGNGRLRTGNEVIRVNLENYLRRPNNTSPPNLKPGDVVFVPRNAWSRWRSTFTIIRDLSVVASLYLLYLRL